MEEDYGEVKLFGSGGSRFSTRIHIVLKLKGVEYKYIEEDLKNKSEELVKYNPIHKKVPVLVHNGNPIAESLVILEYIDGIWKNYPIFPSDPYDKAQARFWSTFIDDKVVRAIAKASWTMEEKERERGIEEVLESLKLLEKELKGKKLFGGETIGIVDIAGLIIAFWLPLLQEATGFQVFRQEEFPKLYEWSCELCNHPIVKDNLPSAQKLLDKFKANYAAMTASK